MQEYLPAVVIAGLLFVAAIAIGMFIEADTHAVGSWKVRRSFRRAQRGIMSPR